MVGFLSPIAGSYETFCEPDSIYTLIEKELKMPKERTTKQEGAKLVEKEEK